MLKHLACMRGLRWLGNSLHQRRISSQSALSILTSCYFLLVSSVAAETNIRAVEGLDCLSPPFDEPETSRQEKVANLIAWLRTNLEPYPPLVQILSEEPPKICLGERLFGAQGYYDLEADRVVLRDTLSVGLLRAVAIHELRHVHQIRLGACPNPNLSMQATARVTLAMEADASAVSLAIAWELKQAGQPEVWNALSEWHTHSKLAQAFEQEMLESGDMALATGAAFSEWYEIEWIRESYYVAACSAYLDRQDATHAIARYGSIEPEFLGTLCTLPNGVPYPCEALGRSGETRQ